MKLLKKLFWPVVVAGDGTFGYSVRFLFQRRTVWSTSKSNALVGLKQTEK